MSGQEKSTLPLIESAYSTLTNVEKIIADYFLHNKEKEDFSSKAVSARLAVSEASLSRFSKKCGFKGYREFIFLYENGLSQTDEVRTMTHSSKQVLSAYDTLLSKSYSLVSEEQLARLCHALSGARRVFAAGEGSSAFAAEEFAYRFMRLGMDVDALSDPSIMRMQASIRNDGDICIGFSLSGKTPSVLDFLTLAGNSGATTILVTANHSEAAEEVSDEILLVPSLDYLDYGTLISPQFPLLVMIDLLYGGFLNNNREEREKKHSKTLQALGKDPKPRLN